MAACSRSMDDKDYVSAYKAFSEAAAQLLKSAADAGEPYAAQFLDYQNGKMPDYGVPLEEALRRLWNENK